MNSRRVVWVTQWVAAFGALGGIVLVYQRWLHVNPTTVAMTMLLYILAVAARSPLRYPVLLSIAATAAYNFYFLPPTGTFTINDPQNWLALFAFLTTGIIGSRLSRRVKQEAEDARRRQREIELLFQLSREVLQIEDVVTVLHRLPGIIRDTTRAERALLFLLAGERIYDADLQSRAVPDVVRLRELASSVRRPEPAFEGAIAIPLQEGARPRGLLLLWGTTLSMETVQAIGGLASIALDRAHALEAAARSEAAKESERIRTLILDSITHELRTPLTAIKGAASTMLTATELPAPSRQDLLSVIDEEADRLNRMIGEAVELAEIEAGEVRMTQSVVSVASILDEARQRCAQVWVQHPVQTVLDGPERVIADAEMIVKVLCHLLENAHKYSPPQSPITITVIAKGSSTAISVADRGVGIEAAEQDLIFERLYRSRSTSGSTSGTGMGLAISRAIVAGHGGWMELTSQVGDGSVFTIHLKRAEQVDDTDEPLRGRADEEL